MRKWNVVVLNISPPSYWTQWVFHFFVEFSKFSLLETFFDLCYIVRCETWKLNWNSSSCSLLIQLAFMGSIDQGDYMYFFFIARLDDKIIDYFAPKSLSSKENFFILIFKNLSWLLKTRKQGQYVQALLSSKKIK